MSVAIGFADAVWERVLDLRNSFSTTTVVTSHHSDEIDRYSDRIALINRGKVATMGTPTELKNRIGPDASPNDVFIELAAGSGPDIKGEHSDAQQKPDAVIEHG